MWRFTVYRNDRPTSDFIMNEFVYIRIVLMPGHHNNYIMVSLPIKQFHLAYPFHRSNSDVCKFNDI